MNYELKPIFDKCKSFYGKAEVVRKNKTTWQLKSYGSIVLTHRITAVKTTWIFHGTYSNTTMRHIREYVRQAIPLHLSMASVRKIIEAYPKGIEEHRLIDEYWHVS